MALPEPELVSEVALDALFVSPLGVMGRALAEQGDVALIDGHGQTLVVLGHPDFVAELLVEKGRNFVKVKGLPTSRTSPRRDELSYIMSSDRERHLEGRRAVQEAFQHKMLPWYEDCVLRAGNTVTTRWRGQTVDLLEEMKLLVALAAGEIIFGRQLRLDEAGSLSRLANGIFAGGSRPPSGPSPWLTRLPSLAREVRMLRQLLSFAEGSLSDPTPGSVSALVNEALPRDDRPLELVNVFMAAFDATASGLFWMWYLLNAHAGGPGAVEVSPPQQAARGAWLEALRLYPPAWVITRQAIEDDELGGHFVPRGTTVAVSPYFIHRDCRWYEQPSEFKPARWSRGQELHRFSFLPYGGGAHQCAGLRLADAIGIHALTALAGWDLRPLGEPPDLWAASTLRPRQPVRFEVHRREHDPGSQTDPV